MPYKDPETQQKAAREGMAKLLRRRLAQTKTTALMADWVKIADPGDEVELVMLEGDHLTVLVPRDEFEELRNWLAKLGIAVRMSPKKLVMRIESVHSKPRK